MKVPLIDGWQNAKLDRNRYPVSRKDEGLIDEWFGQLQEQGRMEYTNDISPFALPVFVVWRSVHAVEKGRAVVDLRPLNKWAVPDSYPLPLQSDVVDAMRGKQWITVVDATKFFFQLLVHPDDRDRFTFISHRGLERIKVAPMGFRNSPATPNASWTGFSNLIVDIVVLSLTTSSSSRTPLNSIWNTCERYLVCSKDEECPCRLTNHSLASNLWNCYVSTSTFSACPQRRNAPEASGISNSHETSKPSRPVWAPQASFAP